jgi:hypothetical protein
MYPKEATRDTGTGNSNIKTIQGLYILQRAPQAMSKDLDSSPELSNAALIHRQRHGLAFSPYTRYYAIIGVRLITRNRKA